jgi:hypothetical protein
MPHVTWSPRPAETFPEVHDKLYELFERPKKTRMASVSITPPRGGAVMAITRAVIFSTAVTLDPNLPILNPKAPLRVVKVLRRGLRRLVGSAPSAAIGRRRIKFLW